MRRRTSAGDCSFGFLDMARRLPRARPGSSKGVTWATRQVPCGVNLPGLTPIVRPGFGTVGFRRNPESAGSASRVIQSGRTANPFAG